MPIHTFTHYNITQEPAVLCVLMSRSRHSDSSLHQFNVAHSWICLHQLAKFMICIILQDWRGNIKSLKLANLSRETNSINKIQKNLSLFTSV